MKKPTKEPPKETAILDKISFEELIALALKVKPPKEGWKKAVKEKTKKGKPA